MQLRLATSPRFVHADARETDLALRDAALLAWLALEGPTPRTRLAVLLWPRSAPDVAGNALRQRLFQLRRQLGVELVSGHTTLALADGLAHDLGDSQQVLGDAGDELGPELVAWLALQRERRSLRAQAALEARADVAERAGDHAAALAHAGELLERERLSEAAHRRVIRLLYLHGPEHWLGRPSQLELELVL